MVKSIHSKFSRSLWLLISFSLLCFLIACGGSKDTTSSSTGSNTTTTTQGFLTLAFTLGTNTVNSVTYGTPVTATATLTDSTGTPVSGAVVTFAAASTTLLTFSPATTALTNSSGVATIFVAAVDPTSAGATSITATAPITSGGTTTTISSTPLGITVNGATLTLGAIALGSPSIYAYGTTTLSVPVFVDSAAANVPISVSFSSPCSLAGKAVIPSATSTGAGIAASTYTDKGCGAATDLITASITGATSTATINIINQILLNLSSNVLAYGTPVTATATLTDSSGNPVQGAIVTFTVTDSTLVTFTPTAGTALTNASGVATIQLNAESISSSGATSITAAATVGGITSTSAPAGISVGGATVTLGTMTLGSATISAYGTSSVTAPVLINGVASTIPISVTFTSPCVTSGKATITSPVTSNANTGNAISTYKDNGCGSGTDTITASATGSSNTSSVTITVTPPATNNIQFISATPSIIGTSTEASPTLPQTSLVKFQVLDINNNGKAGVLVDFTLMPSSAPGGVSLSAASATSDASGYVTVSVNSGTIPTPVWVVATVDGTTIKTQSNTLTITTGLPTQNFFSLSASTHNIEGWLYDGVTSALTIIASDRLGNPVPDGTAVSFITEGAQVVPASCTTASGTCAITFRSSVYRPINETPGVAATYWNGTSYVPILVDGNPLIVVNGRVTLVAYSIGEESFIDANGNNSYDTGETFYDLGDVYIDANENGQYDTGETYIALNLGTKACLTQPANTALPANYSDVPSKDNTCSQKWDADSTGAVAQNYVRRSQIMILSDSFAVISNGTNTSPPDAFVPVIMGSACIKSFGLILMDRNGNPMPAGTTIGIGSSYVYYTPNANGGTPTATAVAPSVSGGTPVGDSNHAGGTLFSITVAADCSAGTPVAYPRGSATVNVATPKGNVTEIGITFN
ncbi:MAG TPA: hypothetical protein VMU29_13660 [Smithella sp.]|nr:hypothetical protein [Smithella sp.]